MSLCEGVREVIWLISFLTEINFTEWAEKPIQIFSDSKAAIDWTKNQSQKCRTKHIGRQFHFMGEN